MKSLVCIVGFFLVTQPVFAALTLEQAIQQAIAHHPGLKAEHYSELTSQQNEKTAQSSYYPKISAMALATTGFPGSAGATGVAGLMVSPYHKGPSAGLYLEQNIWDFGRTSDSVLLAEKETDLAKKDMLVSSLKIAQSTQEIYFVCARDRSLAEVYSKIAMESELVEKEVDNFVRVGQKSIVDKYLSKSQTEEAKTQAEDYKKRFELDKQRLAYLTGEKDLNDSLCPLLDEQVAESTQAKSDSKEVSPVLSRAQAETELSQVQKSLAQKDFNPKIIGIASAGWINDTEFGIPMQNYSAAVAVILPLFEGFKTSSQVRKYQLQTIQNEKRTTAVQFGIDEANLNYDRGIQSALLRIERLKDEVKTAELAFQTAKKRYFDLQGTLLDLREAIRNQSRTSEEFKVALFDFATQNTSKRLLNGQWNQAIQWQESKEDSQHD